MTPQATQVFWREIAWPPFQREKTTSPTSRVFFDVISYVYTHVDNREGATASDLRQRRRISLEEKSGNFISEVRK